MLLTAGFGYLQTWFYHCALEHGCSSRLAVIPGIALLVLASLLLYRFRNTTLIQPIFVTHLPKELVPLAKLSPDGPTTVEIFRHWSIQ